MVPSSSSSSSPFSFSSSFPSSSSSSSSEIALASAASTDGAALAAALRSAGGHARRGTPQTDAPVADERFGVRGRRGCRCGREELLPRSHREAATTASSLSFSSPLLSET